MITKQQIDHMKIGIADFGQRKTGHRFDSRRIFRWKIKIMNSTPTPPENVQTARKDIDEATFKKWAGQYSHRDWVFESEWKAVFERLAKSFDLEREVIRLRGSMLKAETFVALQKESLIEAITDRDTLRSENQSQKELIRQLREACKMYEWHDGEPDKIYRTEWFIAKLDNGDNVVLTALPEAFSYDYKTADDTYYRACRIKKWMQFPSSQFIPYDERTRFPQATPTLSPSTAEMKGETK
jgi:hypothetical protein